MLFKEHTVKTGGDYALDDIGDNGDAYNDDDKDADNGDNEDTDSKPGYDYYATYDEDSSAVKSGHDYGFGTNKQISEGILYSFIS